MGEKTDHDFIIEMHTDMKYVRKDVGELKDEFKAQDGRISKLEQFRWYIIGAAAVVAVAVKYLL